MIYTDGECPLCPDQMLKINNDDLYECLNCHLQLAVFDPLLATVMPERGEGQFRPEPVNGREISGMGLAKSKGGTVLADEMEIFKTADELVAYVDGA